jgi:predicted O-methyltransferase YrrM
VRKIRLSRAKFSRIFWKDIFDSVDDRNTVRKALVRIASRNEPLRQKADYNTGSVSIDAMMALYSVCNFFKFHLIAEVGTFIGNSTCAMALGSVKNTPIHTCDHSNDLNIAGPLGSNIIQYPKASSSEMFIKMASKSLKADMIFLDGRLTPKDFNVLGSVVKDDTFFVFDDFEGIEKGVANASALMSQHNIKPYYHLVYPHEGMDCRIALMIPKKAVEWTDQ